MAEFNIGEQFLIRLCGHELGAVSIESTPGYLRITVPMPAAWKRVFADEAISFELIGVGDEQVSQLASAVRGAKRATSLAGHLPTIFSASPQIKGFKQIVLRTDFRTQEAQAPLPVPAAQDDPQKYRRVRSGPPPERPYAQRAVIEAIRNLGLAEVPNDPQSFVELAKARQEQLDRARASLAFASVCNDHWEPYQVILELCDDTAFYGFGVFLTAISLPDLAAHLGDNSVSRVLKAMGVLQSHGLIRRVAEAKGGRSAVYEAVRLVPDAGKAA